MMLAVYRVLKKVQLESLQKLNECEGELSNFREEKKLVETER